MWRVITWLSEHGISCSKLAAIGPHDACTHPLVPGMLLLCTAEKSAPAQEKQIVHNHYACGCVWHCWTFWVTSLAMAINVHLVEKLRVNTQKQSENVEMKNTVFASIFFSEKPCTLIHQNKSNTVRKSFFLNINVLLFRWSTHALA